MLVKCLNVLKKGLNENVCFKCLHKVLNIKNLFILLIISQSILDFLFRNILDLSINHQYTKLFNYKRFCTALCYLMCKSKLNILLINILIHILCLERVKQESYRSEGQNIILWTITSFVHNFKQLSPFSLTHCYEMGYLKG